MYKIRSFLILLFFPMLAFSQEVGVNFNGQLDYIDFSNLERTRTTWVRGFVDFFQLYNDPTLLDTDERLQKYVQLKENGFKTLLNIKWSFRGKTVPTSGSTEMNNYLDFLDLLLDRVWAQTDIIVVGNEPIIEADQDKLDQKLVNFYIQAALRVNQYRSKHTDIPIFLGAFDNLYQSRRQKEGAVLSLLDFIKDMPWLAGVDVHIHHTAQYEMTEALDFATEHIRADQHILITEYSLMKHWRSQLTAKIPGAFSEQYQLDPQMANYAYLDTALKAAVPRAQWVDYLKNSPWFENRKHYLLDTYTDVFQKFEQVLLATYAYRQSYPFDKDFTATTDPWILNGLYVNRTVLPDPETKQDEFNYTFMDDFHRIQNTGWTDVAEVEDLISVHVFPNPFKDKIALELEERSGQYRICLYDLNGKLRWEQDVYSRSLTTLEGLGRLPEGLYVICVFSGTKLKRTIRIAKTN